MLEAMFNPNAPVPGPAQRLSTPSVMTSTTVMEEGQQADVKSPEEDAISEKEPGGEKVQEKEKEEKTKELMWKL